VKRDRMYQAAASGYATATDLADALVRAGVPFRESHHIVGKSVAWCIENGVELHEMPESVCRSIDHRLTGEMVQALSVEACVAARNHIGGTAPEQVRRQCAWWRQQIEREGL